MKYPKLRAAANAEILAVIENLPVNANGFFLTEEQMSSIEAALATGETATGELATANAEVTRLTGDLLTVAGQLSAVNGQLATAQAEVTRLENLGGTASGTSSEEDPTREAVVDPMAFDFQQDILKRLDS